MGGALVIIATLRQPDFAVGAEFLRIQDAVRKFVLVPHGEFSRLNPDKLHFERILECLFGRHIGGANRRSPCQ